ncbi:protease inhibitor I42 family protein [Pseudomonas sp. P66]|uniref:Protease inhibitor I42 family protein n=1 Tax=Pseudomonas arcuscaelestis TaxID=2710591 RepID=A0ABS2C2S4_9PSED|nr:protease inhibitor I42 family protein [Pseudomonas arcuscaelestis]MBM3107683.1 protease inhibitor I42 family protein [Pseudomonas arcuscaelestis]MBM5460010.1 protease inhibitor I42 family protein [Pseudomonas arcuscaelestis]
MKINRKLLVLGLPLLLAACTQTPGKHDNLVLEKASQCPVHLETNQTLTLTLPSNPSTGYRWLVQNPATGILRSLGPEVYSHPEDAGVVGSAGQSLWRFQAQATGEGHLILVYQQPWAPEVRPAQTFDCAISVK